MRNLRTVRLALAASALVAALLAAAGSGAPSRPEATGGGHALAKVWIHHLRAGARADPDREFSNPSRAQLKERLADASRRFGFEVVRLNVLRPRQDAPLIVVRVDDRRALARRTGEILRLLDPGIGSPDGRSYEGLFFEARGPDGRAFLVTFSWWRGPRPAGGQWASSERLLPFAHG
ncbi:MAG: hypothetical protein QOD86_798 [Miltoncostaeaceae bacterium]|jgi:hypothetical protein|nr:hypothetical protein [Miltoncostaeaceae bacterium]